MSIGDWISCGIIGLMTSWAGYLVWAEYRMHHPKKPKLPGSNIKGPIR